MRTNGRVALGWEANAGVAFLGIAAGQTIPLVQTPPTGYVALTGAWASGLLQLDGAAFGARGELGLTWDELSGVSGAFASVAGVGFVEQRSDCKDPTHVVLAGQIGVRWIGGQAEVFLAPTADVLLAPPCDD
jgi:hypothetical protein